MVIHQEVVDMATKVYQLKANQIKDLQHKYQSYLVKTPPYAVFQAKLSKTTLTAYQSGKVVVQGQDIEEINLQLSKLGASIEKKPTPNTQKTNGLPAGFASWSVVGSDEVGTGSYFGPLTVCAAYVSSDQISILKELGVKDSKSLSDKEIQALAKQLKELIPYKLLVLWPEKYNQVQTSHNQNAIKAKLHNQALALLTSQLQESNPELAIDAYLIDQFATPKSYFSYLKGTSTIIQDKVYFITKGESHHLAVAAASIIARDAFLQGLDSLSKDLSIILPSGAGANVDIVASEVLKFGGMDLLKKVAKVHFANTEKAVTIIQNN